MKVYMLTAGSYSDECILGIYSTLANAESAKAEFETPRKVDWDDDLQKRVANSIQTFTLDEKSSDLGWEL